MRAVMSGGSVYARPRRNASKNRRRLEDAQVHVEDLAVLDVDVHAALALDAGQRLHAEHVAAGGELVGHGAASSWVRLCTRKGSDPALNVRKKRITSTSGIPCARSRSAREAVFGVSCGPKQP